ncbi:hypothetical protein V493_01830 [Pseudogymnoascus sp. VKM F-4281 (FW-2241)]|nr:hypothetical protein V493_01830 [Pseudogymnoascus sp. VKM F-4281 (FW-2241)]
MSSILVSDTASDDWLSAYTEEVRRGEHTLANAIDTIAKLIKRHPEAVLILFEVAWRGIICAGQLKGAVSFLNCLGDRLNGQEFETVLLTLRTMFDNIVGETSWDTWAAAFTAADFLHQEYGNDDTFKMMKRIQREAVFKQQQIIDQSALNGQWSNIYLVLNKLQSYYEQEKHRERRKRENFQHLEAKHFKRTKQLTDDLAEVLQATLRLAVQERQWVDASHQVIQLLRLNVDNRDRLNADVDDGLSADGYNLSCKLEEICSNAISEGRCEVAYDTMRAFTFIPDYANVAKQPLERLHRMWYASKGIAWTYGNTVF